MTPAGAVTTNVWNDESWRTVLIQPDGDRFTTTYNGDGQIYQQQTPTATTKLINENGKRLVEQFADGTPKIVYTTDPQGRVISQKENQ